MTLPLAVQQEIVRRLKPLEPAKVILFGSYARGTATEESDIDLAVVVPGPIAKSCDERLKRYMPVSQALLDLQRRQALDIIVRSLDETGISGDNFWREVEESGEVLYAR
jgi:predicted nucleotidyltransferase